MVGHTAKIWKTTSLEAWPKLRLAARDAYVRPTLLARCECRERVLADVDQLLVDEFLDTCVRQFATITRIFNTAERQFRGRDGA